MESINSNYIH